MRSAADGPLPEPSALRPDPPPQPEIVDLHVQPWVGVTVLARPFLEDRVPVRELARPYLPHPAGDGLQGAGALRAEGVGLLAAAEAAGPRPQWHPVVLDGEHANIPGGRTVSLGGYPCSPGVVAR